MELPGNIQEAVEAALEADRTASLRDVFAGVAFGAMLTHDRFYGDAKYDRYADDAYVAADAMLRARQRRDRSQG